MDVEYHGEPLEPFGVDHGELDGLTPMMCFTLGVEWEMVRQQIAEPDEFSRPIHAENRERIAAMIERHGREYRMTHMHDDVSEGWLWLAVAQAK